METKNSTQNCCCCSKEEEPTVKKQGTTSKSKLIFGVFRSAFLSLLIAFFPKCPVCWALYMSMFGSVGLSQLPYMKWLLPVFVVFLGFHLFMQFKGVKKHGYLPFSLSLIGASIILISRSLLSSHNGILILGILFIVSGTLINSFLEASIQMIKQKNQ